MKAVLCYVAGIIFKCGGLVQNLKELGINITRIFSVNSISTTLAKFGVIYGAANGIIAAILADFDNSVLLSTINSSALVVSTTANYDSNNRANNFKKVTHRHRPPCWPLQLSLKLPVTSSIPLRLLQPLSILPQLARAISLLSAAIAFFCAHNRSNTTETIHHRNKSNKYTLNINNGNGAATIYQTLS